MADLFILVLTLDPKIRMQIAKVRGTVCTKDPGLKGVKFLLLQFLDEEDVYYQNMKWQPITGGRGR